MLILSIVEITRLNLTTLGKWVASRCGFVTTYFAFVTRWWQRNTLLAVTHKARLVYRVWHHSDNEIALLLDIAGKADIPLDEIQGFTCKQGRWFLCLRKVGWLRASDLLSMSIKMYSPTPEEVK